MKNKIMLRLCLYFFISFIIFAIIIGVAFSILFSRHNINMHKIEIERQAAVIANILSETLETSQRTRMGMGRHGMTANDFNTHMRLIEDIVVCSVWVIDRNLEQIVITDRRMRMQTQTPINSNELPNYAEQIIIDAFDGKSSTSESFSEFFGTPAITAAAPMIFQNGEIIGAVLLHSYIYDIKIISADGIEILLYSIIGAIIISVFVAAMLSSRFTKPLNKMKSVALQISNGDYFAKTGITQSDEIGELAIVLDEMADRLSNASEESTRLDKLRRDFVANISHELRTPITVIRGSLEAICDGIVTDAEKVESYNKQMLIETIHLERLVSDLLDLARLQNPDFIIEMSLVSLKDILEDVIRSMKEIAERKNIKINYTYENGDFMYMGDYGRLRQMIIIILDNAIKFSYIGQTVNILLKKGNITISDKGCGISPNDLPHIFERFYKQRSEDNKTGSGLGLAIAKQIADRHEVILNAKSKQGEGAEFSIEYTTFVIKKKQQNNRQ